MGGTRLVVGSVKCGTLCARRSWAAARVRLKVKSTWVEKEVVGEEAWRERTRVNEARKGASREAIWVRSVKSGVVEEEVEVVVVQVEEAGILGFVAPALRCCCSGLASSLSIKDMISFAAGFISAAANERMEQLWEV